ncbi:MAG: hypothetical protein ACPLRP_06765, partial [Candidatus Bipolaricaulaceae bacterium]
MAAPLKHEEAALQRGDGESLLEKRSIFRWVRLFSRSPFGRGGRKREAIHVLAHGINFSLGQNSGELEKIWVERFPFAGDFRK